MQIKKLFLDTNIVLDLIDSNRKFYSDAIKIIKYAIFNSIEIVISEDMLSTIYYVNKDKTHTLNFFNIILHKWTIIPFGNKVILKALNYAKENNCDLEDTLQCFCALSNSCNLIISNDAKFVNCGIEIFTTTEFLKSINE